MSGLIHDLWSDRTAATAVEYALMAALIAAVIVTAVVLLGQQADAALGSLGEFAS